MNTVMLVGRLTKNPEIIENLETDKKECIINLAINRGYKNQDGIYETDFIPCSLWEGVYPNVTEYCHKGDTVGVKGSLISKDGKIFVRAERVSFLGTSNKED